MDAICAKFAGLEPLRWIVADRADNYWHAKTRARCEAFIAENANDPEIAGCEIKPEYLSFSTDWAAAGRLMDALQAKQLSIHLHSYHDPIYTNCMIYSGISKKTVDAMHESGPMALALAVAELAKESK